MENRRHRLPDEPNPNDTLREAFEIARGVLRETRDRVGKVSRREIPGDPLTAPEFKKPANWIRKTKS